MLGGKSNGSHHAADPIDLVVGIKLKALRQERGMSQSELGERLGITFQQVQKYERSTNRVPASILVKSAEALGVAPSALLPDCAAAPSSLPPAALDALSNVQGASEMVLAFAGMEPHYRRELLRFAQMLSKNAGRS